VEIQATLCLFEGDFYVKNFDNFGIAVEWQQVKKCSCPYLKSSVLPERSQTFLLIFLKN
jgi:hypothetical protein